MTAETVSLIGYGAAAPAYWDCGWKGILPLPRGQKHPPPAGRTGYNADTPSYADIIAWSEDHPGGNIALHLPDTVIGIDVDGYDQRTGLDTLAHAESLWGPLPDTVMSTARPEGSGIRYYQVPAGTRLTTQLGFPDLGLGHVEIIQTSHRYAVVWPSQHPSGGIYLWVDHHGTQTTIPHPDNLPHLPPRWLTELAAPTTTPITLGGPAVEATSGNPDLAVADRLAQAVDDLTTSSSRHDTTTRHVLALLRLAEQGHPGVDSAIDQLGKAFTAAVTADGTRDATGAHHEYRRMVDGERGHALIAATPTPEPVVEEVDATTLTPHAGSNSDDDAVELTKADLVDHLTDNDFWQARPSLAAIYDTAHARLASPWSVLGAALARTLATIPPWITLPPIIGGPGSLNCFWALVGRSGAGKGISEAVASELVPLDPDIAVWPAGSGEGLAHAYVRRATPKEIKDEDAEAGGIIRERTSAVFSVPEVDTLASISGRQGSTIMSKLRSAYSGEEIGFAYADPTKRLLVGAHQYRMQMILGVQPERAGGLIGDAAGGTPQRFVWLPSNDPTIGDHHTEEHPPLPITPRKAWAGSRRHVDIPDSAVDEIRAAHIARARGEGDAIDGHALQTREKVMVGLCVLDGRTTPDELDWLLAGKIMSVSDRTRSLIEKEISAAADREAEIVGRSWGIRSDVANLTSTQRQIERVEGAMVRALQRHGPTLTRAAVSRHISSRDRDAISPAVENLVSSRVVSYEVVDGEGWRVTLVSGGAK